MQGVGMGLQSSGVSASNKKAQQIAREQMAFQERMSSTAYQRATKDMRSAGINPMLAYMQGGASTSAGASYTPENVYEGFGQQATNSALDMRRLKADLTESETRQGVNASTVETQKTQQELNEANVVKAEAEAATAKAMTGNLNAQSALTRAQLPRAENRADVERKHPKIGGYADAILDRAGALGNVIGNIWPKITLGRGVTNTARSMAGAARKRFTRGGL